MTTIYVAAGGALGAALRFLTGTVVARMMGTGFPLGVMTANIMGSFLMGLLVVYLHQKNAVSWQPFLLTGVLGGYTTFSAFSLETVTLFEKGMMGHAMIYVLVSVAVSVLALVAGVAIARGIWV